MKLKSFTIKNFRSIKTPLFIKLDSNYVTFTGKNNCGKSNILRALDLFFNEKVDNEEFNAEIDMHKMTIDKRERERTNVTCTFELNSNRDKPIIEGLEALKKAGKISAYDLRTVSISYTVTRANRSQVQYIDPYTKQLSQSPEVTGFFNYNIRRSVDFLYVPAVKDLKTFVDKDISRELLKRIFNTWGGRRNPEAKNLKKRFEDIKRDIENIIEDTNTNITGILQEQNPDLRKFLFNLPFKDLIEFLSYLPISMDDGIVTGILQKGSGVQAITIYSILRYLDRYKPSNKYASAQYIWAIEEPETCLHPEAQKQLYLAFQRYSQDTQILSTTHSYYFLNSNQVECNYLLKSVELDGNYTETTIVPSITNYWEPFVQMLGDFKPGFVPPGDENKFYLFCEGDVDIDYIKKALSFFPDLKSEFSDFELVDGGGNQIVSRACDALVFKLKASVLVDGDDKGRSYFSQLLNRGYKAEQNLFAIEKHGATNPTMESIVSMKKLSEFRKTMPQIAIDHWFSSRLKIDLFFDNTQDKPPAGWDKDSFKRKLCNFMLKNGEPSDFLDLKAILEKIVAGKKVLYDQE